MSLPWSEKYRPSEFTDIVLSEVNASLFQGILTEDYIPNMLFYGPPGTGKTTTIINLVNAYQRKHGQLNQGLMIHLNASDERGVDVIRNQINAFVASKTLFGQGMKFVILDEVDYMTKNAQMALTYLINDPAIPVRFILICNYISRIDETLRSMLVKVHFNHLPPEAVVAFLTRIVEKEQVPLREATLHDIQTLYGSDIRSMINYIQSTPSDADVLNDSVWADLYAKICRGENINVLTRAVDVICERYKTDHPTAIKDFLYYVMTHEPAFPLSTIPSLSFAIHATTETCKVSVNFIMLTLLRHCSSE